MNIPSLDIPMPVTHIAYQANRKSFDVSINPRPCFTSPPHPPHLHFYHYNGFSPPSCCRQAAHLLTARPTLTCQANFLSAYHSKTSSIGFEATLPPLSSQVKNQAKSRTSSQSLNHRTPLPSKKRSKSTGDGSLTTQSPATATKSSPLPVEHAATAKTETRGRIMLPIAASMHWKLSSEVAQDTSNDGYRHAYAAKACCDNRHLEKHTRTAIPQTQHDLLILFLEPQVTFCLSNQTPNWRTSPKLQSTSCKTAELLIGPQRSPWQFVQREREMRSMLGAMLTTAPG